MLKAIEQISFPKLEFSLHYFKIPILLQKRNLKAAVSKSEPGFTLKRNLYLKVVLEKANFEFLF